jgi:hypothetical protein
MFFLANMLKKGYLFINAENFKNVALWDAAFPFVL